MPARSVCLDCPTITEPGHSRCPPHERTRDKARGTRQQRGYDAAHDAERERWAPYVEAGIVVCDKCNTLIQPGSAWDLGHNDRRTAWTGPEHAHCNRGHRPAQGGG